MNANTSEQTILHESAALASRTYQRAKLIDLKLEADRSHCLRRISPLKGFIEKLLSLDAVNLHYSRLVESLSGDEGQANVFDKCLQVLNVTYRTCGVDLSSMPAKGPLVVVANHPFGALEGVIIGSILSSIRQDVKILGNYFLDRVCGIRDCVIPVDPFARDHSAVYNLKGLREAIKWVRNGGALTTFPAGEVSHVQGRGLTVADSRWKSHIGAIIRCSRAAVLPIYFHGRNSLCFQALGLIHPMLRTAFLPRELVNKCHRSVQVVIGKPISRISQMKFSSDEEFVDYLRSATYFLKNLLINDKPRSAAQRAARIDAAHLAPLGAGVSAKHLLKEIQALPGEDLLVENSEFAVYIADALRIPNLLEEIGRLRELTFRDVGEGTGQSTDLDRFDVDYLHLVLWSKVNHELVGAYRLGCVDRILRHSGRRGLYTSELFQFKPSFLRRLECAVEVGRSFIRSEYQRKLNTLALLWRGIGAYMARHPHYRILFGPVSISREYHAVSRSLMIRFLKENRLNPELSRLVKPRNPYRLTRISGVRPKLLQLSHLDIDDVSILISTIESDGKGVPILLRQYLKLNAQLVGFNVDPKFSSVVDGLLIVDLDKTEPRILKRYMGEEGYTRFSQAGSGNQGSENVIQCRKIAKLFHHESTKSTKTRI